MKTYRFMTKEELCAQLTLLQDTFAACKAKNLNLNMARGKPAQAQLDLCADILTVITKSDECFDGNIDARNYGELAGLPCARNYWAEILGCKPEQTFIGGNASLNLMYDVISKAYTHGLLRSVRPWCKEDKIKFLCPAPGYDRHFRITESFGAELITVPTAEICPCVERKKLMMEESAVPNSTSSKTSRQSRNTSATDRYQPTMATYTRQSAMAT